MGFTKKNQAQSQIKGRGLAGFRSSGLVLSTVTAHLCDTIFLDWAQVFNNKDSQDSLTSIVRNISGSRTF